MLFPPHDTPPDQPDPTAKTSVPYKALFVTSPRTTVAGAADVFGTGPIRTSLQAKQRVRVSAHHSGIVVGVPLTSSGIAAAAAAASADRASKDTRSRDPRTTPTRRGPYYPATLRRTASDKAAAARFDAWRDDIKRRLAQRYGQQINTLESQLKASKANDVDNKARIASLVESNAELRDYATKAGKIQARAVTAQNQLAQDARDSERAVVVCVRRIKTATLNARTWLTRHIKDTSDQQTVRVNKYYDDVDKAIDTLAGDYKVSITSPPPPEKKSRVKAEGSL